jgi:mRNA interferase RelE/StbE
VRRYRIEAKPAFERSFDRLPDLARRHISARIDLLADDPRPDGCQKLAGSSDLYRIRVGQYRVIYQVLDAALLVLLVKAGHRREVYR